MPEEKKLSLRERIRRAIMTRDADGIEEALGEISETPTSDPQTVVIKVEAAPAETPAAETTTDDESDVETRLAAIEARLTALEQAAKPTGDAEDEDEKKDGDKEDEKPTGDAEDDKEKDKDEDKAITADAYTDVVSRAAILAPSVKAPTRDSATAPTLGQANSLRRSALQAALKDARVGKIVGPLIPGGKVSALTADALPAVFHSASVLVAAENNRGVLRNQRAFVPADAGGQPPTNAELNEINRKFYGRA